MIKLQVIGHLGRDAAIKQVNNKNVIDFSVASTETYKDAQGNTISNTTWVECSYWTERTGVATYLKKGKQVYVEGKPSANAYTNKDGQAVGSLNLNVRTIELLGSSGNAGTAGSGGGASSTGNTYAASNTNSMQPSTDVEDDLPF